MLHTDGAPTCPHISTKAMRSIRFGRRSPTGASAKSRPEPASHSSGMLDSFAISVSFRKSRFEGSSRPTKPQIRLCPPCRQGQCSSKSIRGGPVSQGCGPRALTFRRRSEPSPRVDQGGQTHGRRVGAVAASQSSELGEHRCQRHCFTGRNRSLRSREAARPNSNQTRSWGPAPGKFHAVADHVG